MAFKDLVPNQPAALTDLQISDLQKEFSGAIEVRSSLIKIPYVKVNQQMSEATAGELGKLGDFTCKTRGLSFGSSITIIPILLNESASLLDETGMKAKCQSKDLLRNADGVECSKCPHGQYWNDWGTREKRKVPACKAAINVLFVTPTNLSNDGRLMMSFRKTSHPAGKALVNLISGDPLKVAFGSKYTFHSSTEYNAEKKKNYYVISAIHIDKEPLTQEELAKIIPIARHTMDAKRLGNIVHDENEVVAEEAVTSDEKTPF